MPKRRLTPKRKAQIKAWQLAGQLASLKARHGYSHPAVKQFKQKMAYKSGQTGGYTPPGLGGRRSKLGGKAYAKKTASNFKPSQELKDLMAGKTTLAQTTAAHASSGMGHNGAGLKASPRGGGHKIAPSLKAVGAKPAKKAKPPGSTVNLQHGSGTGLTSAYRYLPTNVAARKRKYGKQKGKSSGTF